MARNTPNAPATDKLQQSKKYTHTAPIFVSLKEGESIQGVFIDKIGTQYGPGYRFRIEGVTKILSGNRAQLDGIFDELAMNDADFPGGLVGHQLRVVRLRGNIKTKAGRTVGQYEIEHVFEGCPHGCVPESI